MYSLPYFKEKDEAIVLQFVRDYPFAFLCGCDHQSRPVATQLPVFIDEREGRLFLSGHMMRNTDHQKAFATNPETLAIFTGPNHYVSASWYENPLQGSTWNYQSVHARGRLTFLDEAALRTILKRTTDHFENDPLSSAAFDKIPESYLQPMMKAIVAFEIEVMQIDNVFKLSQNRDEKSYDNIISKLKHYEGDGKIIAELMEQRKGSVFSG